MLQTSTNQANNISIHNEESKNSKEKKQNDEVNVIKTNFETCFLHDNVEKLDFSSFSDPFESEMLAI